MLNHVWAKIENKWTFQNHCNLGLQRCLEVCFLCVRRSYLYLLQVVGESRDVCVLIQTLSSVSRQWCVTLILEPHVEVSFSSKQCDPLLPLNSSRGTPPEATGSWNVAFSWLRCSFRWLMDTLLRFLESLAAISRGWINPVSQIFLKREWCDMTFWITGGIKLGHGALRMLCCHTNQWSVIMNNSGKMCHAFEGSY